MAQGVEGIAVGLASKILPHNFNELIDACIAHLKHEDFVLYPDFPTGGMIDVSKYCDGMRGGNVKIRAKIEKDNNNRALKITEIPFGRTTSSLIDSIIKANEKGKIKIKKIDDNTARDVEILIQLAPGVSSDKTIDALYAFTDCELSISPNSCVHRGGKTPVYADLRYFAAVGRRYGCPIETGAGDPFERIAGRSALCVSGTYLYRRTHL